MKKRRILTLITLILCLPTLCGCWNYKEISDLYFLPGFAIDYDTETDKINLTIEIAAPKVVEGGSKLQSIIFQSTGINCFEAIRNIIPKIGRKLSWSHAKVLILGTSVFEKESALHDIIDFIGRTVETREDLWVFVSKEKTAGEILTDTETELQPIKSFIVEESLKNEQSLSKYEGVPVWEFFQKLTSPGSSPTLPVVLFDEVKGKKTPLVWGEAIFRGTKLIGWLEGDEVKYKLMVTGEYKGGIYSIDEVVSKKAVKAAVELKNLRTKKTSVISENQIGIDIEIKLDTNMVEISNSIDISEGTQRRQIEETFKKSIELDIQEFIKKIQNDYGSDIFGFSENVRIHHYKDWEEMKSKWQDIFPSIKVNVKVDLEFLGSSILTKPRKVKE